MAKIKQLNKRQDEIVSFLEKSSGPVAVSQITDYLRSQDTTTSRMTINRDLRALVERGWLTKTGAGRGAVYLLSPNFSSIKPIDVEAYYKADPDKRIIKQNFNFEVFSIFGSAFGDREKEKLIQLNKVYRQKLTKLSATALKREYERLTIELSWKSSKIEGNTYTLLETDYLLSEHKEPKGHTKAETAMILNHKVALDYIRANQKYFKVLSVKKIEEVHSLLIKDLGVAKNIRTGLVRVAGTAWRPLDNKFQIKEALEKMCKVVNKEKNIFAKSLIAMLMIAYIQPFEDGNKRASRLIGNALLMANNACPLSFRSIDELEYKKAILLFYEQNNFRYFKELFIQQFEFAVSNYFG